MFWYLMSRPYTLGKLWKNKCPHIKNCVHLIYIIVYVLWNFVLIEYIELCTLFKNLCTTNIQNCVYFLNIEYTNLTLSIICEKKKCPPSKNCVLNRKNCVFFFLIVYIEYTKFCTLKKNCLHWIYKIVYIESVIRLTCFAKKTTPRVSRT